MDYQVINSDSLIKLELPNMTQQELQRVQEAMITLLDTKFFKMRSGRITLFIHDGFIMKKGIYIEEKVRGT